MSLQLFTDLMTASTAADLNGPEAVSNQVTRTGYMLKYLLKGYEGFETIQGGTKIRSDLILDEVSTALNWAPGQKFTHSNPQVLSNTETPWRFTSDFRTWNGPEILLNTAEMSTHARNLRFVSMQKKIDIRVATSIGHFMEDQCTALPIWSEMEEDAGLTPNSLLTFCNELKSANAGDGAGLFSSYRASGGGDNKVMSISKLTKPNWDNVRTGYASNGVMAAGTTHLFDAFEDIWLDLGYKQLPGPDGPANSDPIMNYRVCFTQKLGVSRYSKALRLNEDFFRANGPLDPNYNNPKFDGMPIVNIASLDTAPVYPTIEAAASGAETTYGAFSSTVNGNGGPRYHIFDFSCLQKVVHSQRYFYRGQVKEPVNQLEAYIQPITMYHNNCCEELRKQGCIYPTANV